MSESIAVYQTDAHQFFAGESVAYESPLEPGTYLIPAGCVAEAPPVAPAGQRARYIGGAWYLEAWAAPVLPAEQDPVQLLAAFLAANPSVADLLKAQPQG